MGCDIDSNAGWRGRRNTGLRQDSVTGLLFVASPRRTRRNPQDRYPQRITCSTLTPQRRTIAPCSRGWHLCCFAVTSLRGSRRQQTLAPLSPSRSSADICSELSISSSWDARGTFGAMDSARTASASSLATPCVSRWCSASGRCCCRPSTSMRTPQHTLASRHRCTSSCRCRRTRERHPQLSRRSIGFGVQSSSL